MTREQLRAWLDSRNLTRRQAAEMLGLSVDGLGRQLDGSRKVSEQTRQLCLLWDAYDAKPGGTTDTSFGYAYGGTKWLICRNQCKA